MDGPESVMGVTAELKGSLDLGHRDLGADE